MIVVEAGAHLRVAALKGDVEERSAGASEGPWLADEMRQLRDLRWEKIDSVLGHLRKDTEIGLSQ